MLGMNGTDWAVWIEDSTMRRRNAVEVGHSRELVKGSRIAGERLVGIMNGKAMGGPIACSSVCSNCEREY